MAITGGARGIGAATGERLRRDGARVTLGDLDATAAEATAARLGAVGLGLDVTRRESFTAFLDAAEAAQGPLDVLINNAGIMPIGPFLEEPDEVAKRLFEINVHGVILGMKIALPRMLSRGNGQIVNLASAAGRLASLPGEATYVATKHAVVGLSEAVRCELEGHRRHRDDGAAQPREHPPRLRHARGPRHEKARPRRDRGRDRRRAAATARRGVRPGDRCAR